MEMKQKLAEARKKRLEKSGPKSSAPSMVPTPYKSKAKKIDEEPPKPTLGELVADGKVALDEGGTFLQMVEEHTKLGQQERAIADKKKPITKYIKDMIEENPNLANIICGESNVSYYETTRSTVSKTKLLEHGISVSVINECTDETTSKTLKIRALSDMED